MLLGALMFYILLRSATFIVVELHGNVVEEVKLFDAMLQLLLLTAQSSC